eukprot:scaffold101976_cov56-Phaeocystis_antarctica.AAC.2
MDRLGVGYDVLAEENPSWKRGCALAYYPLSLPPTTLPPTTLPQAHLRIGLWLRAARAARRPPRL